MRLSVELMPADPDGLRALADSVSRPGDPRCGHHLSRATLAARLAQPPAIADALGRWFAAAGIDAAASDLGRLHHHAPIERRQLTCLFGHEPSDTLMARRRLVGAEARRLVPGSLTAVVAAIEVGPWRAPEPARALLDPGLAPPPPLTTGLTPAELARGYDLDRGADGDGETIAVMALGGVPDPADLHGFARAFDLPAPQVELVPLTPSGARASDPHFRLETTMGLQWLAAVAPRARLVVYLIDPALALDPWATFLRAVLADMSRSPSIAVTTWSAPARQYYPVHGRQVFAALLDQAAALGVSVVAASGDWGAHDGFPSGGHDGRSCQRLVTGDTFPGCEARVLSVGGTRVVDLAPWRELAWSAPVSAALRALTGLPVLAGSGGVSEHVAIPDYQRPWLPASFSRGPDHPPQPVCGRVQPDVALMAWGLDVPGPAGPRPTAYACLVDRRFRDDGGGTSVAAPIWAGILARLNQRRRARGLPRLGQLHPRLYAACASDPTLLRDITEGRTDIELPIATPDGDRTWRRLPGFEARSGYDPATGLGVPAVARLEAALAGAHEPRLHVFKNRSGPADAHLEAALTGAHQPPQRTAMRARMYQRPHRRSPAALAKPYTFLDTGVRVDVAPLVDELARATLPYLDSLWKWHRGTRFCVLRGGPPGPLPGDELTSGAGVDAPILAALPRLRAVLDGALGVRAPLAWIGLSPPNSAIRLHVDNTPHWDEHHRLHLPLVTSPGARLCVVRRFHHFPAGHLLAFNNSRPHGAINEGPRRLHLVLDVAAGPAIDALLANSAPIEGQPDDRALSRLCEDPLADLTPGEPAALLQRFLSQ